MQRRIAARLLLCAGVALLAAGCSPTPIKVAGEVLFDGQPVESGSISFVPADGKGREFGGVIQDGKYQLVGPPEAEPGEKIVRIVATCKTGKQIPAGSPSPPGTMVDELLVAPKKYNEQSELRVTLERGDNKSFDVHVKSK